MRFDVICSIYIGTTASELNQMLLSLVNQSYKSFGLIIVIDGPIRNEIPQILAEYQSKLNVHLIERTENRGLAYSLNEAINFSEADYIFRIDTDDRCLPNRLEMQIKHLQVNKDVTLLGAACIIQGDGDEYTVQYPLTTSDIRRTVSYRNPFCHSSIVVRRQTVVNAGGYPQAYPEDYLLWIRLICQGEKCANLPNALVVMKQGSSFHRRRGLLFLRGEIKAYFLLYQLNEISFQKLCVLSFGRALLRIMPTPVKKLVYKLRKRGPNE